MTVELTTSWQRISKQQKSFSYSGYSYTFTLRTYARYEKISNTVARIHYKLELTNDSGNYWSGTNKNYYIHLNGQGPTDVQWGDRINGYTAYTIWEGHLDLSPNVEYSLHGKFNIPVGTSWDISDNVKTPKFTTSPTGLNVSNIQRGIRDFTATVSITGWGVGSGTRYRELQVWTNSSSGLVEPRRYQPQNGDALSGTITCGNSSYGSLNITPNTMYVIGAYATNGTVSTGSVRFGEYSTLADTLQSKSAEPVDTHTIKINYTTKADGGKYAKKIQYSLDNSTWTTGATVSTGSSTSGSFNITGLNAGTQYTVYLRISTDAGITTSGSVTTNTKTACKIIRGNSVIEAIPYVIKPDGTKIELNVRRV